MLSANTAVRVLYGLEASQSDEPGVLSLRAGELVTLYSELATIYIYIYIYTYIYIYIYIHIYIHTYAEELGVLSLRAGELVTLYIAS